MTARSTVIALDQAIELVILRARVVELERENAALQVEYRQWFETLKKIARLNKLDEEWSA